MNITHTIVRNVLLLTALVMTLALCIPTNVYASDTADSGQEQSFEYTDDTDYTGIIQEYLTVFLSSAFWYGMLVTTLLSFIGYGVFKAFALININKRT